MRRNVGPGGVTEKGRKTKKERVRERERESERLIERQKGAEEKEECRPRGIYRFPPS